MLVVDDEQDWREALCTELEALGADVQTVGTAAEAMDLLNAATLRPLTVLVIDIGLPETDGYSLLKEIRALNGPVANTPAVAVTAYADNQHRLIAGELGFDAFCSKPISPEDVAAAIPQPHPRARRVNRLVVEHERHHHVHLILADPSVIAAHVLLLDPRCLDIRSVLDALVRPCCMASSKLFVEVALISDTLATDILPPCHDRGHAVVGKPE